MRHITIIDVDGGCAVMRDDPTREVLHTTQDRREAEWYVREMFPCHTCGTYHHIDLLDAKDDGTGNFTILQCRSCYGSGWAPARILEPIKFIVSCDHRDPRWTLDHEVVEVHPSPGKPNHWYVSLPGFGCGKDAPAAESAILQLLFDNGCSNIDIEPDDAVARAETKLANTRRNLSLAHATLQIARQAHAAAYQECQQAREDLDALDR